jgi:2-polyprenyl-3-methyl-5-hydroxy-6-metoxy-1,4-benzoquinol methylase
MDFTTGRPRPVFDPTRRSAQSEILDGHVETRALANILSDLARFNGTMMGHRPVLRWLDRAVKSVPPERPLTLLDVGCGYGDLLRAVRRWARKRGRRMALVGIDVNPRVIEVARAASEAADAIDYRAVDVFDFAPAGGVDFVTASLVAHHLSDATIVRLLRWLEDRATHGWLIYDLQRSRMAFRFIALAGPLLRLHPVVTYDGRVSVARSLTRGEWRHAIAQAGIEPGAVDLHWFMFRFVIGRLK